MTESVEETTEAATEEQTSETTFTQADVDRIVKERLSKEKARYEGFDDYKTRAEEAEALKAKYSELESTTTELSSRAEAAELKALRLEVSMETDVPVSALTATNEDDMRKQAEDLKAWRGENTGVKREAANSGNSTGPAQDAKARAAEALRRL